MNFHGRLHVVCGCKHLCAAGWNCGVAFDEFGHHSTLGLDAERKWCHVKQQHILHVAAQNTCLHGRADSNYFVGVNRAVWFFAGEALNEVLYRRHTCRTANQNDVVDLALGQTCISDCLLEWFAATLDQVGCHLLKLGTRQRFVHV